MRLFPSLESVWANMSCGDGFARQWVMERRVCSPDHFDSCFRFAIGDEVLTSTELASRRRPGACSTMRWSPAFEALAERGSNIEKLRSRKATQNPTRRREAYLGRQE